MNDIGKIPNLIDWTFGS